ncbi:MAG: hypothetical protein IJ660_04505 [Alphaproteobacteria bacterium]|nr:hypothetical protein [Alphaproteobacteria bacterium]
MHLKKYVKIMLMGIICSALFQSSAQALWPTFDCSAIFQNAQSIMQKIDQYKTQILESKTVTSINSAIGDAKASMSKFNLDKVQEVKKKADKLKKAKEKLDKIKKKVEDAKKEYEKKKAKFDEYKKKVEDAKKEVTSKIDEAKSAYNDAKSTYEDAKSAASGAVNLAGQAVADAKDKVNNVKSTINSTVNAAEEYIPKTEQVTPASPVMPEPETQMPVSETEASTIGRVAFTPQNTVSASQNSDVSSQPTTLKSSSVEQVVSNSSAQGSSAGVSSLDKTLKKAVATGDIETLKDISTLDEADIINSDSKVYEEPIAGRKAFVAPNAKEVEPATLSDTIPLLENLENTTKASSESTDESRAVSGATRSLEKLKDVSKSSSVSADDVDTIKGATESIQINRRAFGTPQQESLLFDDGEYVRQSSARINYQATLKFADVTQCSDYNNAIQNSKDGEIIITSETLAKECCFKAEDLTDMKVIQDCANILLKKMNDEDATIAEEARGIYSVITAEQNVYGLTEAWKDKADSGSYFANVLTKYIEDSDKIRKDGATNDAIASIAITNKESLYLLNRIRRIFTSSLVNTAIGNIGAVKPETLDEETEIGLGEIKGDYDYSVIRGLHDNVKESEEANASIEYPVLPENFAKKCLIKLDADNIRMVKDCYYQTVKEANDKDFTKAEVGKNFIDNIKYQDMLNILGKSLYQKVKTAKYDEELDVIKENITNSQDERTNFNALFKTDNEMQKIIDEIVQIYAARIATSSLENLGQLTPKAEDTGKEEG